MALIPNLNQPKVFLSLPWVSRQFWLHNLCISSSEACGSSHILTELTHWLLDYSKQSTDRILWKITFTKILIIIQDTKVGIALQMDTFQVSTVMLWRNFVWQIQDNALFLKAKVNQKSTFSPLPILLFFLFSFWPETLSFFYMLPQ